MASLEGRVDRLEARRVSQHPSIPKMSAENILFLKLMRNERHAIEREDAQALGKNPDFGDGAGPEPLTEAEEIMLEGEPEYRGPSGYLDMLLDLRATASEDARPAKLSALDLAIQHARETLSEAKRGEHYEA